MDKDWTPKRNSRFDRFWFCIEDPFELSHNLGRVADRDSLFTLRGEFMRAAKVLEEKGDLAAVCEQFEPPPPAAVVAPANGASTPAGAGSYTLEPAPLHVVLPQI